MSFSLKNFIEEEFKKIVDLTKYNIVCYDEQQEAYEESDNTIIFIIKCLNGTIIDNVKRLPYQILVYTPIKQSTKEESDPIIDTLNYINEFVAKFNATNHKTDFSLVRMIFTTPTSISPLAANSIAFRNILYFSATTIESINFIACNKVTIDNFEISFSTLALSFASANPTTTNYINNYQFLETRNKNLSGAIVLNIPCNNNVVFQKLKAIRKGLLDINTIFYLKLIWSDDDFEEYDLILNNQSLNISKIDGENVIVASFTIVPKINNSVSNNINIIEWGVKKCQLIFI